MSARSRAEPWWGRRELPDPPGWMATAAAIIVVDDAGDVVEEAAFWLRFMGRKAKWARAYPRAYEPIRRGT